jgi:hypothetical protein
MARMRATSSRGLKGPHFEPDDAVDLAAARGQHQDRHVACRAQAARDRKPVFAGQHQIKHHEIEASGRKGGIGFARIAHGSGAQAVFGQQARDKAPDLAVVVHDQNMGGAHVHDGHQSSLVAPCRLRPAV